MKMIDMGKKQEETKGIAESPKPENKICYPSLSLYEVVPDGIFNKKIGDTFEIRAIVKLTNKGIDESTKHKNKRVSLDITKLGIEDKEAELESEMKRQQE